MVRVAALPALAVTSWQLTTSPSRMFGDVANRRLVDARGGIGAVQYSVIGTSSPLPQSKPIPSSRSSRSQVMHRVEVLGGGCRLVGCAKRRRKAGRHRHR